MREDRDTHLRTRSRVVGDVITVHDQILGESRVVLIVFVVSSDAHATGRDDVEPSSRCADRARGDARRVGRRRALISDRGGYR